MKKTMERILSQFVGLKTNDIYEMREIMKKELRRERLDRMVPYNCLKIDENNNLIVSFRYFYNEFRARDFYAIIER